MTAGVLLCDLDGSLDAESLHTAVDRRLAHSEQPCRSGGRPSRFGERLAGLPLLRFGERLPQFCGGLRLHVTTVTSRDNGVKRLFVLTTVRYGRNVTDPLTGRTRKRPGEMTVELLRYANREAVAQALTDGGYSVTRQTVNRWARGDEMPGIAERMILGLFGHDPDAAKEPPLVGRLDAKMDIALWALNVSPEEQADLLARHVRGEAWPPRSAGADPPAGGAQSANAPQGPSAQRGR